MIYISKPLLRLSGLWACTCLIGSKRTPNSGREIILRSNLIFNFVRKFADYYIVRFWCCSAAGFNWVFIFCFLNLMVCTDFMIWFCRGWCLLNLIKVLVEINQSLMVSDQVAYGVGGVQTEVVLVNTWLFCHPLQPWSERLLHLSCRVTEHLGLLYTESFAIMSIPWYLSSPESTWSL